jgi:ABC-type transport system involved in multi-copper enzyme maturation permease subunit
MQAYIALLRYDAGQLARSWLVRIWIALLVVPALFIVVVAANSEEQASETLAAYVAAGLVPLSALVIAIVSAAAVSAESSVAADSILSRSVTRSEYIAAKVTSRLAMTLIVFTAVAVPFAYLILRYSADVDTSIGGVIAGLTMVAAALVSLAALGIALSTLLRNSLLAALIALVVIIASGAALQFLGLSSMSSTALLDDLPATFRGETALWHEIRVVLVFGVLAALGVTASVFVFRRRDL